MQNCWIFTYCVHEWTHYLKNKLLKNWFASVRQPNAFHLCLPPPDAKYRCRYFRFQVSGNPGQAFYLSPDATKIIHETTPSQVIYGFNFNGLPTDFIYNCY
ncbi:MAG: hypothetical protein WBH71_01430 [Bacteroidales bacterium]|nr:hypothetical protein [Bacteroidales bacterium]MDI9593399.1 hypothetical protein [Bacteroidota bacterium]HOF81684.1 hypothetical protein [Bacteroidales bacterium]HOR76953.1 hypothetical protein [Bacteroidales bacterium]HPL12377.1 hypothetical protein [Bacteroidales bacterium]